MKEHHAAWLAAHPNRTEAWLRRMTRDGFDIHHIDWDRSNNSPDNLVLIEAGDHMMLHGSSHAFAYSRLRYRPGPQHPERDRKAYDLRHQGFSWREAGEKLGIDERMAKSGAHSHRKRHNMPGWLTSRRHYEGPGPDPAIPEIICA